MNLYQKRQKEKETACQRRAAIVRDLVKFFRNKNLNYLYTQLAEVLNDPNSTLAEEIRIEEKILELEQI